MGKGIKKAIVLSAVVAVFFSFTLVSGFSAGETVVKVEPGANTLADVLTLYETDNSGITVTDLSGTIVTDSTAKLGTGYTMVYTVTATDAIVNSVFVVRGDVNGNGVVDSTDLNGILGHVIGGTALTGVNLEAADLNHDGIIDALDGMMAEFISSGLISPTGTFGDNEGDVGIFE